MIKKTKKDMQKKIFINEMCLPSRTPSHLWTINDTCVTPCQAASTAAHSSSTVCDTGATHGRRDLTPIPWEK